MTQADGITPNERSILFCLAIGVMCERTASTVDDAEEQLDNYAITVEGDTNEVRLSVAGQLLVRVSRAWLAEVGGEHR